MSLFNAATKKTLQSPFFLFYYFIYYVLPGVLVWNAIESQRIQWTLLDDSWFILCLYYLFSFSYSVNHFPKKINEKLKIFIPWLVTTAFSFLFYFENFWSSIRLQSALTVIGVMLGIGFVLVHDTKQAKNTLKHERMRAALGPVGVGLMMIFLIVAIYFGIIHPFVLTTAGLDTYIFLLYSSLSVFSIAYVHGRYFLYGKSSQDN